MPPDPWPTDPDALAELAAHTQFRAQRERALADLVPILDEVARSIILTRKSSIECDELVQQGYLRLHRNIVQFNRAKGPFRGWAFRLLDNVHTDLCRQRRRSRDRLRTGHDLSVIEDRPAGLSAVETSELSLGQRLAKVRRSLDLCSLQPSRAVHYPAVFLLYFRLELLAQLATVVVTDAGVPAGEMASRGTELFPWRAEEETWRLHRDLPDLANVWARLEPFLDQPPYFITPARLCEVLTTLRNGGGEVTRDQWHQWTSRARKTVQELLSCDEWSAIECWFRRPGRDAEEGEC
jgi:DNA-directed RNA polymerase specialized sigma24 family protein